ncbi:YqjF family protein [Halobacillus naozhouensis]|uniref:DUF2071 domain-containing protein n=1 Tax=Halobacillus naozhouensis TaxID=554880 RepID=A0ABY8J0G0_9BACI|nr:DUF2071 domain-containing protein [Halobacillus naozhouensis]WFT75532.1 DUF2071 domain-containing protein [Halobacillus naozhouensis]
MYKNILESIQHRVSPLPRGPWVMTQKWEHLLFMHLPVPKEVLAQHIPKELEVDTFEGQAWITIIPFMVSDMRLRNLPSIPYLKSYLELNVRTYVRCNGLSGIYFFSLDADKILAILGARLATLPYYYANMTMNEGREDDFHYKSVRKGSTEASFKGSYRPISTYYYPGNDSLSFWLLERYHLWTIKKGVLFRGDIHHKQWKVHDAKAAVEGFYTLIPFLPDSISKEKLLFHYASSQRVLIWRIKKVE